MDAGLAIFTAAGIAAFAITTIVTVLTHRLVIRDVGNLTKEMADIRLVNSQILQKNAYNLETRRKAEMVAELFALWIQSGTAPLPNPLPPGNFSKKIFQTDDWRRLNELSFMSAFWLPQSILDDVYKTLQNKPGAKNIKQILIEIRKEINVDGGAINPNSIVHF